MSGNHGGRRPGAGRKPEPGRQIIVRVRVLSEDERTRILALSPRERVEAMLIYAAQLRVQATAATAADESAREGK